MLTKKELEYVNTPTGDAPFPGLAYATCVAEQLLEAFELYKSGYQNKEYDVIMSNGETLSLEIQNKNLCHMLGIDYKRVSSLQSEKGATSYQVLEWVINRLDDIIKHDRNSKVRYLNYFKVMIKSTILMSFSDFTLFDFGIIDFNKDKYDESKYKKFSSNSTTLLFTPSNEIVMPHYIMGLKKDPIDGKNIVETLYATSNVQDFMDNQTLLIPTQILITDNNNDELTKLTANPKEKIEILRLYQTLIAKNGISANIDIMGDYESMLMENASSLTRKNK